MSGESGEEKTNNAAECVAAVVKKCAGNRNYVDGIMSLFTPATLREPELLELEILYVARE